MAFEDTLKSISLNADSSIAGFTGVSGVAAGGGPSTFVKISSISGTNTINTASAHGYSVGDVVYIANATTAGNNGGFTVATIPSSTSFTTGATYTNQAGAAGTVNKTNFNQLYRFVKLTGAKTAGLCTSSADYSIGVLQNKPQYTGQAAQVGFLGVSFVITGAGVASTNITAGDKVASDTLGAAAKAGVSSVYAVATSTVSLTVSATTTVTTTIGAATTFKLGDLITVSGGPGLHNGSFYLNSVTTTTNTNDTLSWTNNAGPATANGTATTTISTVRQPVIAGVALASSSTPGELIPVLLAAR
jgi:hypothetical protein